MIGREARDERATAKHGEHSRLNAWMRYLRTRAIAFCTYAAGLTAVTVIYRLYKFPDPPIKYTQQMLLFLGLLGLLIDLGVFWGAERRRRVLSTMLRNRDYVGVARAASDAITANLAQELAERHRIAEELHERDREYMTMWLHQIKNPIAGIKLELQDEADLEHIEAALLQVEHYIEMAIHRQRMNRPSKDLVFAPVSLREFVTKEIERLAPLARAKGLQVRCDIADEIVVSDAKWLSFVLAQILINAIKYTYEGSVRVRVEERSEDAARHDRTEESPAPMHHVQSADGAEAAALTLRLVIEDTGMGIAAADLPRLFEWGYTGNNGRIDKRSTGIGLYMSRQILTMLGGSIEIASEQGRGTSVRLTLPRLTKP